MAEKSIKTGEGHFVPRGISGVNKVLTDYLLKHPKHKNEQQQRRRRFSRNAGTGKKKKK